MLTRVASYSPYQHTYSTIITNIPSPPTAIGTCCSAGLSRILREGGTYRTRIVDFDLLRPTHRTHPYRYDKMHERGLDFYLIEVDIDQPATDERIFHGEVGEFLYGFFCVFDLKRCKTFDFG